MPIARNPPMRYDRMNGAPGCSWWRQKEQVLRVAKDDSLGGRRYCTVWSASVTVTTSSGVLVVAPSLCGWNSTVIVVAFTITRR